MLEVRKRSHTLDDNIVSQPRTVVISFVVRLDSREILEGTVVTPSLHVVIYLFF